MLSTWKKQRCKLNEMVDAGKVLHTKRNCESFLPQVERALHLWFCEMRSKPHAPPINQSLLVQKVNIVSILLLYRQCRHSCHPVYYIPYRFVLTVST